MHKIVSLIRGGMGNQMFQVAFSGEVAERFGAKLAFVDLTGFARVRRSWMLSCFGIECHEQNSVVAVALDILVRLLRRLGAVGYSRWAGTLIEGSDVESLEAITKCPWLIDGYWQNLAYLRRTRKHYREIFRFPAIPAQHLMMSANDLRGAVAIQVRRRDYTDKIGLAYHLVCGAEWYREAWRFMRERVGGAQAVVFSDEPAWVLNELELPGRVYVVPDDPSRPAWVDMAMMSYCSHFIISNSTFGWWAAFLGEKEASLIVLPQYWRPRKLTKVLGLVPPGWIQL